MNPNSASWRLDGPLELLTNTAKTRTGRGDPTGFVRDGKMWRAAYFSSGPASLAVWTTTTSLCAETWGPGASDALASVPGLAGLCDDHSDFAPSAHPFVAAVARKRPGVRLVRTEAIFDAAVRAVLAQKVTGVQAKRSYQALARRAGVPAPLPRVSHRPLVLPPTPEATLQALAGHGATTLGIDITRATALREVALVAHHLDALATTPAASASTVREALQRIPGVGVWTANQVTVNAIGDHDAVSVGDYHLKNWVSFALTGEPRGTDQRMVELLEPFRPHRARAIRLIELAGLRAPRYGPKLTLPAHVPGITDPRPSRGAVGRSRASQIRRRAQ